MFNSCSLTDRFLCDFRQVAESSCSSCGIYSNTVPTECKDLFLHLRVVREYQTQKLYNITDLFKAKNKMGLGVRRAGNMIVYWGLLVCCFPLLSSSTNFLDDLKAKKVIKTNTEESCFCQVSPIIDW